MEIISTAIQEITISLSRGEIGFLNNAINETLNALEDWEFQTRTGWTRVEAEQLLSAIQKGIRLIPKA